MSNPVIKKYHFSLTYRYWRAQVNEVLVSGPVVFALAAFVIAGVVFWGLFSFGFAAGVSLSAAILCFSVASLLVLLFAYGTTYLPFMPPPRTSIELLAADNDFNNVADALTYDAVLAIGRNTGRGDLSKLWSWLVTDGRVRNMLFRLGMDQAAVTQAVSNHVLPNLNHEQLAYTALSQAAMRGSSYIDNLDLAGVFLLHPQLHVFWRQNRLKEEDVSFSLWWQHAMREADKNRARWWDPKNMLDFSGVGLQWASGYTPFIDQFARVPSGNLWDVPFGHMPQVEQLITALARARQSNVLVVGHPGVGRLGVVKEMIRRVHANQAHPALRGQRVVYLHLSQIVAMGTNSAQQLATVSRALDEMERAGNVIAVLDGISSILGAQGESTINLTEVIQPFFSSQTIRVVAIMSSDEYHLRIKTNEEMVRLFEVVDVPPLDEPQTLALLALSTPAWEKQYRIHIPYQTLREVVENTAAIMPYVPFPEKAFDILEEAIVYAGSRRQRVITIEIVQYLISQKVGMNVGQLRSNEQQHLLNLEEMIHQRVVNQQRGVTAVVRSMIRARAGVRNRKRPIGTFLFLGPTGVGKTETAKALAAAFFGTEEALQRLDMSEFQGEDGVARLIGSSQNKTGRLTSMMADHPFAVLLLDEFEKADPLVQQIFLPVFDEGYLTDAAGRRYSFHHTIIIATSNAGAEFIRQTIETKGKLDDNFDDRLRDYILEKGIFRPEALNRFDGVITFSPLSREHIREVAGLMLKKLNKRLDAEHGVTVDITDELKDWLAQIGYDPEFGARPMARAIQDTVEYAAAEQIIKGTAQPGQRLRLNLQHLGSLVQKR